jgi:hypothetical protein
MRKVLILDTSILCVWLKIPGKDTCGPANDCWDHGRVEQKIDQETSTDTVLVLPLASIIETGNHIAHAKHSCKERAEKLAELMRSSADECSPWAAFADQSALWSPEKLRALADSWPRLAAQGLSLADATIKDVAEHYATMGCRVEILTGDRGMKAYEPLAPPEIPRRRKSP